MPSCTRRESVRGKPSVHGVFPSPRKHWEHELLKQRGCAASSNPALGGTLRRELSPHVPNLFLGRQNVSHGTKFFLSESEAPKAVKAQLGVVLLPAARCSGDSPKLAKKPLHPLTQGVRVNGSRSAGSSIAGGVQFELDQEC